MKEQNSAVVGSPLTAAILQNYMYVRSLPTAVENQPDEQGFLQKDKCQSPTPLFLFVFLESWQDIHTPVAAVLKQRENVFFTIHHSHCTMYRECDSVVSSQRTPAIPNLRFPL